MTEIDTIPTELRSTRPWIKKLLLVAVVLVIVATIYLQFRETLSIDYLASQESQLRQWQVDFPLLAAMAGVAIYVGVAGLSLPGAAILTLAYGWYFGLLPGTAAYVYAGSTVPSLTKLAEEGVGSVLSWQLVVAFVVIGVLPLAIKRIVSFISRYRCNCEDCDMEPIVPSGADVSDHAAATETPERFTPLRDASSL